MTDSLLIAVHVFVSRVSMSILVYVYLTVDVYLGRWDTAS